MVKIIHSTEFNDVDKDGQDYFKLRKTAFFTSLLSEFSNKWNADKLTYKYTTNSS